MAAITIRILRDNTDASGASDDVIRITPSDDSDRLFDLTYTDHDGRISNTAEYTENEIYEYLDNLFDLLPADNDPFDGIQIFAPSFPSVLIRTNDLTRPRLQDALYRVIRNTLRNFPWSAKYRAPARSTTA